MLSSRTGLPRRPGGRRRSVLAGLAVLGLLASTGCQVEYAGMTLPSGKYFHDDVQYFAPGPEFPYANTQAATQRARMQAAGIPVPPVPASAASTLGGARDRPRRHAGRPGHRPRAIPRPVRGPRGRERDAGRRQRPERRRRPRPAPGPAGPGGAVPRPAGLIGRRTDRPNRRSAPDPIGSGVFAFGVDPATMRSRTPPEGRPDGRHADDLPVREGYAAWAPLYDDDGNPLTALEGPAIRGWFGPIEGRRALDLGCGTGRHTLALVEAGAAVAALDALGRDDGQRPGQAPGLSRDWAPPPAARPPALRRLDLRPRRPRPRRRAHRDLAAVLAEAARVAKPGGRCLLSALHPDRTAEGQRARFIDPATGDRRHIATIHRTVDDYLGHRRGSGWSLVEERTLVVPARAGRVAPQGRPYVGRPLGWAACWRKASGRPVMASARRMTRPGAGERDPLGPGRPDHDRLGDRVGRRLLGDPLDEEAGRRPAADVALLDEEVGRGQRADPERRLQELADRACRPSRGTGPWSGRSAGSGRCSGRTGWPPGSAAGRCRPWRRRNRPGRRSSARRPPCPRPAARPR